jgi:hypothetical protein
MRNFFLFRKEFCNKLSPILFVVIPVLLLAILVSTASAAKQDEYERFGRKTVTDLTKGNGKNFTKAMNQEAVLDSVFEGISAEDKTVKELRKGLAMGLARVGEVMVRNLSGANMKFLRLRNKGSERTALMRIDFGDKGLNYLDLILEKDNKGAIKIVDWYDYSKGQLYTDSVRQAIVLLLPEERSLLAKLLGISGINKKEAKQFVELGKLMKEQKYAEWLKKHAKLPSKLKNSRIMLLTRIIAAVAAGDDSEYRLSLKDLHDKMGDDPTLSLILIDYYFYENDFESAQKALDNLSKHIGGDASIDALKANIYLTSQDYAQSIKYAKKAIAQEAGYEDSYWALMNAGIFGKVYDTAVTAIEKLESDFGYDISPEEIEKTEDYKEFSKSEAYKKWKEKQ